MLKNLFLSLLATLAVATLAAQSTDRRFTLKNSADGQSELTVYLPTAEAAAKVNGRAVVDCPGGGYSHLSMDNAGHNWAEFWAFKASPPVDTLLLPFPHTHRWTHAPTSPSFSIPSFP